MSDEVNAMTVDAPVVEGDEETKEPVVDGAEIPEVKEDGDEEAVAPEAGAMPAEDGDKSDAI